MFLSNENMNFLHSLGFRTILTAVVLVQFILLLFVTLLGFSQIDSRVSTDQETSLSNIVEVTLKNNQDWALKLLTDISMNTLIIESIDNREDLYDFSYPLLNRFETKGLRILNYYYTDGSVYLKSENPSDTGSISRKIPFEAAEKGKAVSGISEEKGRVYSFVAAPLFVNGERKVVIELGFDMDPLILELSRILDSPVGIVLGNRVIHSKNKMLEQAALRVSAGRENPDRISSVRFDWEGIDYQVRLIPIGEQGEISLIIAEDVSILHQIITRSEILIALVGLISVFVIVIIMAKILKPISRIINHLEGMGRGDLRENVEAFAIRELSVGINRFLGSIRKIVGKVYTVSGSVVSGVSSIRASLSKLTDGADRQSEYIDHTSTAIQQMSSSTKSVANDAVGLSHASQDSSSAILEMTASIGEVAQSANSVSGIVDATSSSIGDMIASVKKISENVDLLSQVSSEASATVKEFGTSLKLVESSANESAALSEKANHDASTLGMRAIDETIRGMKKIQDTVIRSAEVINRLGQQSEEVGKILTVINEVTRQTNLLALNAAILAAQAGDHGKGFSVVAGQIKELANQTAVSTKEIAEVIREVQGEAREAVETTKDGEKLAKEGVRLSEDAGNALKQILGSSEQSREMTLQIQRATEEQGHGIQQVTNAMHRISKMIEGIALAVRAQHQEGEKIVSGVKELHDISYQVKQATVDLTRGSKQISQAVEDVSGKSQSIASAIKEQERGNDQILSAVEKIKEVTQKNRVLTADVETAVEELSSQSNLLQSEVNQLKT